MWQRNNGQAEDDLQFRFTAYLVSAVKRRRKDYLIQLYKRSSIESTVEVVYESEPSSEEVVLDKLPLIEYSARDCAPQPLKLSIHSGGIEHPCRCR